MGKRRVNKVFQIVAEEDVLDPSARVYSQDNLMSTMKYELKRMLSVTCAACTVKNPVIREVTYRRVK